MTTDLKKARLLIGVTAGYNSLEALIALRSGTQAASTALLGFGIDSIIEFAAAAVVLWRFSGGSTAKETSPEIRARRFVGGTFIALALYVSAQAGWMLWNKEAPSESPLGMALAAASLVIMPLVSWGKLRLAKRIGSEALLAEAKETLACSYLSLTLLLGLVANAWRGWWWADPVAALLMVPWLVKEGVENIRARECYGED